MQNVSAPSQRRKIPTDDLSSTKAITHIHTSPFSTISPYLMTCPPYGTVSLPNREIYRQECDGYDGRYLSSPTHESLPNMLHLIRNELKAIFYEESAWYLRREPPFRISWRRDGAMTTFNQLRLPRATFMQKHDSGSLIQFLNKEIMVYFQHGSVVGCHDDKLGRYFYREWLRLHNGRPPFQRHSFFAKPACFGENGPRTLEQISEFHRTLCHRISAHLDELVDFYPARPQSATGVRRSGNTRVPPPVFNPRLSKRIQSWRDHGFILKHLFRSLIIVVDDQTLPDDQEPYRARQPHDDVALYLEECCDWRLSQCTVLLVKTGEEASLHSPINFQPLFEAGLALDVNREDYKGALDETIVRVKADVAMRFIWDVLYSEQQALGDVGQAAQALVQEQSDLCALWTENVMAHADKIGYEENGYTWLASRRARARLNGEAFDEDQVKPSWEYLRHWDC